jgi:hypothetical protein
MLILGIREFDPFGPLILVSLLFGPQNLCFMCTFCHTFHNFGKVHERLVRVGSKSRGIYQKSLHTKSYVINQKNCRLLRIQFFACLNDATRIEKSDSVEGEFLLSFHNQSQRLICFFFRSFTGVFRLSLVARLFSFYTH